jgi:hypothetical protein
MENASSIKTPDAEWLMIDVRHVKTYPHAARAKGGNQAIGGTGIRTKHL